MTKSTREVTAALVKALNIKRAGGDSWLFSDYLFPSPSGDYIAFLHSVNEVRMGWYFGSLAIFQGPPSHPTLIFDKRELRCSHSPYSPLVWLDSSVFVVKKLGRDCLTGEGVIRYMLIDVKNGLYSFVPGKTNVYSDIISLKKWSADGIELDIQSGVESGASSETSLAKADSWYPLSEIENFDQRYEESQC